MDDNFRYWYNLKLVYLLSETIIGHTEPSVKERWEWAFEYMKAYSGLPLQITDHLEKDLWDEGISIPFGMGKCTCNELTGELAGCINADCPVHDPSWACDCGSPIPIHVREDPGCEYHDHHCETCHTEGICNKTDCKL